MHPGGSISDWLVVNLVTSLYDDCVRGPDWDTQMEGRPGCRVRDLLTELYDKAGHAKQWWLVRHTAGMLRKKVEDLAKAATDIIVRQKQLAVGLPPEPREKIIIRLALQQHNNRHFTIIHSTGQPALAGTSS